MVLKNLNLIFYIFIELNALQNKTGPFFMTSFVGIQTDRQNNIQKAFEELLFKDEAYTPFENQEKTESIQIDGNYLIRNTYFHSINHQNTGGAFYIFQTELKILISESTFNSCSASQGGALAIYSTSKHTDYIMSFVCGFNCKAETGGGQFDYVRLSETDETIDYVYDTSIVSNKNNNPKGYDTMLHEAYDLKFHANNITNNVCYTSSSASLTSYYSSFHSYLLIRNNTANSHNCITFRSYDVQHNIESSNFLNNKQTNGDQDVINFDHTGIFTHCYIYDNVNEENGIIITCDTKSETIFNDCIFGENQKNYKGLIVYNGIPSVFFNFLSMKETNDCNGGIETFYSIQNIKTEYNVCQTCKYTPLHCFLLFSHAIFIHYNW